ncbi:hypothetical protein Tsubulata_030929 [Turnera subulata]|uniref:Uncharacterized protein n=1 Tax=Turnera subulata TaxID=218843 RepID=A0A9Q0JMN5_9ROSI|nr:hypothetical protein Tsubulata_030929 [Turnera subulata]
MAEVSAKFSDVLAFSGPAPERINGRLAMTVELSKGQDVFSQISEGGVAWFVGTLCSIHRFTCSLVSRGFAMLVLVALAFIEFVKGAALV